MWLVRACWMRACLGIDSLYDSGIFGSVESEDGVITGLFGRLESWLGVLVYVLHCWFFCISATFIDMLIEVSVFLVSSTRRFGLPTRASR